MPFSSLVWIGVIIGSLIGGYIPTLFGVSFFSLWSLVGNTVGGILGIWVVYKLSSDNH